MIHEAVSCTPNLENNPSMRDTNQTTAKQGLYMLFTLPFLMSSKLWAPGTVQPTVSHFGLFGTLNFGG